MDKLIALLVSGAVSGAVYSLLAIGLVLTYSVSRVFNFAQGAIAFAATLLFYELTQGLHWPTVPALVVSIAVVSALGLLVNEVVFRRLAEAEDATKIVATVGLSIAIPALALLIVETAVDTFHASIPRGDNIFLPPGLGPSPKHIWHWGPVTIDSNQVIALSVAVVVSIGLWLLVNHTRTGLRMRATVDRGSLAEYRGIDTIAVSRLAYALSFGIAGLAGITGAPFLSLTPTDYTGILVVAAAAAVFARLRSLPMALVGGLLLGLAQSLFSGYVHLFESIPGLASALPYLLLFFGLFFLARDRRRIAGQVAEPVAADPVAALVWWRRLLPWAVGSVGLVVAFYVVSDYQLSLLTRGMALAIIFLSFTVVTGIGGMVSLSQASFALLGAMVVGKLVAGGMALVPATIVAVAVTALVGALFALPALRLGGLSLALSTLALALIGDTVLFAYKPFTNGSYGWTVPRPTIGPFDLGTDRAMACALLVVVLVIVWIIGNLRRSPSGRAILAVRSSEAAASSVGLSTARSKFRVFVISSAIASLGGVMLATVNGSVSSASLPAQVGLSWLAIVVLVGIRRPAGAVIAALLFVLSPEIIGHLTSSNRIQDILFGLGAVQLAKSPDGILTAFTGARTRARNRRAAVTVADMPVATNTPVASPVRAAGLAEATPILELEGLHAGYGAVEVLHGIDLTVLAGRITLLLGAGGAGKSTLCAAVGGGLAATGGEVRFQGEDVTVLAAHGRIRRGMAIAPESRGIFPGCTVAENLAVVLPDAADRELAYERFPALASRRRVEAGYLSGGEQQMLALAPLVVKPPTLLIADEPGLGLAPMIVDQVYDVLRELRAAGTAVLLSEEKASRVLHLADDVAFLTLGRLSWAGPAADVDVDRLADSYLEARR
ncbi:MAG: branched-chain amino acid transporter permease/ATP-binding protein [Acidimicrobiales bacterium]|nr:branched-chain amino acid transporter permease/ATP-binding protein [Acidimicrobiales bacterium]